MIAFGLLAVAFIYLATSAWHRRSRVSSFVAFLTAALFVSLGALCGAITLGIRGYRAFTAEALAATIKTDPIGPHHFRATVTLPTAACTCSISRGMRYTWMRTC